MNCVPWQRGRHPVTGESRGSESRAGHEGAHHGPIWGLGGGSAAGCPTVEPLGTEPSQIIPAEPKSGQGSLGANLHFIFYCMGAPYCPADGQHHRTAVLHTATVTPWHYMLVGHQVEVQCGREGISKNLKKVLSAVRSCPPPRRPLSQ